MKTRFFQSLYQRDRVLPHGQHIFYIGKGRSEIPFIFRIYTGKSTKRLLLGQFAPLESFPIWTHDRCPEDPFDHRAVKTLFCKKLHKPEIRKDSSDIKYNIPDHL